MKKPYDNPSIKIVFGIEAIMSTSGEDNFGSADALYKD